MTRWIVRAGVLASVADCVAVLVVLGLGWRIPGWLQFVWPAAVAAAWALCVLQCRRELERALQAVNIQRAAIAQLHEHVVHLLTGDGYD